MSSFAVAFIARDKSKHYICFKSCCNYFIFWLFRDQGITEDRRLTCASTITNVRESQGEKTISSHIQEFAGIPDMDYDGKKSQTAIGKNHALEKYVYFL